MSESPIQDPSAAPYGDPGPRARDSNFEFGVCLSDAWENTTSRLGLVIGVGIVGYLCLVVSAITIIGYFLLAPVLCWGAVRFGFNVHDERDAAFEDLFSGFKDYGHVLGRTLSLLLIMFAAILPSTIIYVVCITTEIPAVVFGGLVLHMAVSLLLMRLYFAIYFLVDQDLPAMDAVKASWELTRGKWWRIFGLALLSGLVSMAGFAMLGVGALVSVPMSYFMFLSAYRQMVGGPR